MSQRLTLLQERVLAQILVGYARLECGQTLIDGDHLAFQALELLGLLLLGSDRRLLDQLLQINCVAVQSLDVAEQCCVVRLVVVACGRLAPAPGIWLLREVAQRLRLEGRACTAPMLLLLLSDGVELEGGPVLSAQPRPGLRLGEV